MTESNTITGTVSAVRSYGTVVLVFLDGEDGRILPIPFERRPFERLLEGEGCGPGDLVGRRVRYDGDMIHFIE
jgi:hypothetical protein